MTDSEFKALMLRSAENAHRKLFDEYSGYVYSICANKLNDCGSKEDIEECLSDSFAAIFRYFDSESNRNGDLKGIIGTITKRIAVDYFRKLSGKTGRTVSIDDEEFPTLSSDIRVDDETEKAVLREIIMDCIDRLGEPDSSIIVFYFFYGRTSWEIAKHLHMSDWTVQKRISRAKKKLEKLLCDAGITGEDIR
ncbi:MAG: sigma-70 family RNA polymerase sigma factor [Ruminococcus sp.]|nr:sigma-70 family RNA polymerase sigma factor [Ruminococcus sp.]